MPGLPDESSSRFNIKKEVVKGLVIADFNTSYSNIRLKHFAIANS